MKKLREDNREGSVRKLPGGKYECVIQSKYINPKTGNPKRIKRKGDSEQDARQRAKTELYRWEKGIETGRDTKLNKRKTFGQYMTDFVDNEVKRRLTDSGYHSYIRTLRANFYNFPIAKMQLHMLSRSQFQSFYDVLQSQKSHKTVLFPRQICIRCCRWLIDQGLLDENYAEQAVLIRKVADEYDKKREDNNNMRKQIFTPEDIEKFYKAFKNNVGEYPVVVLFLLETGMRASEFAALRNSSINMDTGRIEIVETRARRFNADGGVEEYVKVPKNKQARFVIMSALCRECVEYMQEQTKLKCPHNPDDLLYPTFRNGKRRSNASMEHCFHRLCEKIGVNRDVRLVKEGSRYVNKGLCLHALRHTADSIANTAKGANVVNTALAMGHKAISTENIYTHATEEGLASIMTPSQAVLDKYKKAENDADKIARLEAELALLKSMVLK